MMQRRFSTDPLVTGPDSSRGIPWNRLIIRVEVVAILIIAVALTVAPQVVLDWVAVAAGTARDFASSYRSAVALVGLCFVGAAGIGLWAIVRPRSGAAEAPEGIGGGAPDMPGEAEDIEGGGKQRVA
jgi:hypothetical protein